MPSERIDHAVLSLPLDAGLLVFGGMGPDFAFCPAQCWRLCVDVPPGATAEESSAGQGLRWEVLPEASHGIEQAACCAVVAVGPSLFAFGGFDGIDDIATLSHLRLCVPPGPSAAE